MEGTLKRIINGESVDLAEALHLINAYRFTEVSVMDDAGHTKVILEVDRCSERGDRKIHWLAQSTSDLSTLLELNEEDVVSTYYKVVDQMLLINCTIKNGDHVKMVIFLNYPVAPEREEISLYELEKTLETVSTKAVTVDMSNLSGLSMQMITAEICYEPDEERICIMNEYGFLMEVPVIDDCCNAFHKEETRNHVKMTIMPNGMPFTEISMTFRKKNG